MNDDRQTSRRRIFKAGRIELGSDPIECVVRDVSETGARLEIKSPRYVPEQLKSVNLGKGKTRPV